jgi:hypothetical protein
VSLRRVAGSVGSRRRLFRAFPSRAKSEVETQPTGSDVRRRAPDPYRSAADHSAAGALLFARYAYPPNELGYCGSSDSRALIEYGAASVVDPGLVQLAQAFAGAWPYLELIAGAVGIPDPLDRRVVEAYWVGNPLLDRVDMELFGRSLMERFRRVSGGAWGHLAEAIPAGAVPHHSFHVFGVYPWVGLLGSDCGQTPLHVLDRCRIRWGRVIETISDQLVVLSRPLTWDGRRVGLGRPRAETVARATDGLAFLADVDAGDWVSMHWGWVCDRLSDRALRALRSYTVRQLTITNDRVSHPGPAMALS